MRLRAWRGSDRPPHISGCTVGFSALRIIGDFVLKGSLTCMWHFLRRCSSRSALSRGESRCYCYRQHAAKEPVVPATSWLWVWKRHLLQLLLFPLLMDPPLISLIILYNPLIFWSIFFQKDFYMCIQVDRWHPFGLSPEETCLQRNNQ